MRTAKETGGYRQVSEDLDRTENFGGRKGKIPVRGQASSGGGRFPRQDEGRSDALIVCEEKDTRERVVKKVKTEESN